MSDPNAPAEGEAPAPQGRRCGRCGAINARADAVICSNCGALLAAYDAPAGIDTEPPPPTAPASAGPPAQAEPVEIEPDQASAVLDASEAVSPDQPVTTPPPETTRPTTAALSRPTMPARPTLPDRPDIQPSPTPTRTPQPEPSRPTVVPSTTPTPPSRPSPPQVAASTAQPAADRPAATPPVTPAPPPPPPAAIQFPDEPPDDTPSPAQLVEADAAERAYTFAWSSVRRGSPTAQREVFSAGGFLARQVPQNLIVAGVVALLAVCIFSLIISASGGETAAGFLIICAGPLALLLLGIGIALLFTRGRKNW